MLTEILNDCKLNYQNEQFRTSRSNTVLSIKNTAYQDIDFYQNQIAAELQKQKGLHGAKDAQAVLNALTYQLAEYQLACHLYAFSSFVDVILQRSFDTVLIDSVIGKIKAMSERYEALYADCHSRISKYQHSAIESVVLNAVGTATKGLGMAIGSIPIIKNGTVDEMLINAGESIEKRNSESIEHKLEAFETFKESSTEMFVENLRSADLLYNTENAMITDGENLYILESPQ